MVEADLGHGFATLAAKLDGSRGLSGEGGQRPQFPQGGDECLGVAVGAREAKHDAPSAAHDLGRHVQEREGQPLASAADELGRQSEDAQPARDVVGEGGRVPPQPVAEEVTFVRIPANCS